MLKLYDISDICAACGAPTIPGEQICRKFQQLAKPPVMQETEARQEPEKKKFRTVLREILLGRHGE